MFSSWFEGIPRRGPQAVERYARELAMVKGKVMEATVAGERRCYVRDRMDSARGPIHGPKR
jgi:hypothetical protein